MGLQLFFEHVLSNAALLILICLFPADFFTQSTFVLKLISAFSTKSLSLLLELVLVALLCANTYDLFKSAIVKLLGLEPVAATLPDVQSESKKGSHYAELRHHMRETPKSPGYHQQRADLVYALSCRNVV